MLDSQASGHRRPVEIADLLHPLDEEAFRRRYYGIGHLHLPGDSERFADLLPWATLNELLHRHRLDYPRLRLSLAGRVIDAGLYTRTSFTNRGDRIPQLDAAKVMKELTAGATLILSAVDEMVEPIERLALRMERAFRTRVSVNAYVAFGNSPGFDLHWDDHDVFVLQIHGSKSWRIAGPSRRWPLFRDVISADPPESGEGDDLVITPGDALYLPRGFWHSAAPMGEPTVHLTFGFAPATGVDLMTWLADRMRTVELFRRGVDQLGDDLDSAGLSSALWAILEESWHDGIIDEFLAERDTRSSLRPRFALPYSAMPDVIPEEVGTVRLVSARGRVTARADEVELHVDGRLLTFDLRALTTLELLSDGHAHSIASIHRAATAGGIRSAEVAVLLKDLTRQGVIVVGEAAPNP